MVEAGAHGVQTVEVFYMQGHSVYRNDLFDTPDGKIVPPLVNHRAVEFRRVVIPLIPGRHTRPDEIIELQPLTPIAAPNP